MIWDDHPPNSDQTSDANKKIIVSVLLIIPQLLF